MSDEDYAVVEVMEKHGGGFVRHLAQLAFAADDDNFARIKTTWPELWAKYAEVARLVEKSS